MARCQVAAVQWSLPHRQVFAVSPPPHVLARGGVECQPAAAVVLKRTILWSHINLTTPPPAPPILSSFHCPFPDTTKQTPPELSTRDTTPPPSARLPLLKPGRLTLPQLAGPSPALPARWPSPCRRGLLLALLAGTTVEIPARALVDIKLSTMDAGSPDMFGGAIDGFNIESLSSDEPIDHLIDSAGDTGSTAPTVAGSQFGSRFHTTPSAGNSPVGNDIPSTSTSPTVVDASSQPPSLSFPISPSWDFQTTPPYDATTGATLFGQVPSWDVPVSLSQDEHQQLILASLAQHQNGQQHRQHAQFPQSATDFNLHSLGYPSFAPLPPGDANSRLLSDHRLIRTTLTSTHREVLSPDQQKHLEKIAMPTHLVYQSPKSAGSPDSSRSGAHSKGAGSSPDAAGMSKSGSRKRKSSDEVDDDDDDEDPEGQQPVKKTAHNMIEKRYRTNLNDKIANLRDAVPALRIMSKSARGEDTTGDREELHGLTPAHKLNKATVRRLEPPPPRTTYPFVTFADQAPTGSEQGDRVHPASGETQHPASRGEQQHAGQTSGFREDIHVYWNGDATTVRSDGVSPGCRLHGHTHGHSTD